MWGFGECSEPKLVRAEGNSPRREPWGNSEFAKPRHGATNRGGDIFRPLPGALPRTPHSHGSRRWATIFRPYGLEKRPCVVATQIPANSPESAIPPLPSRAPGRKRV